ncbi:thioredoxin domain-containing protein [Candidatus Woesearchaeota archaeon]|nr:thioredoxin domain-containing protein [Candidatus Woesearchaeota archaeon]
MEESKDHSDREDTDQHEKHHETHHAHEHADRQESHKHHARAHPVRHAPQRQSWGKENAWKIGSVIVGIIILIIVLVKIAGPATPIVPGAVDVINPAQGDATAGQGTAAPAIVPAGKTVLIEEYSDFECPYCRRYYQQTYKQIRDTYGDAIVYEFNHFPLSFHPKAQKSGEASECARDQGRFDEYHDILFETGKLDVPDLKAHAAALGLDTVAFDACLDSGEKAGILAADLAEGQARGITGTPGFFIDGKMLVGAQPFAAFKELIDAALGTETPMPESTDPEIRFIVIGDETCAACDTTQIVAITQQQIFPNVVVEEYDYGTAEGLALAEKYGIVALPAYIFGPNVVDAANYDQVAGALIQAADGYVIAPAASGAVKYLNPPGEDDDPSSGPDDAEVVIIEFSDFQCPYSAQGSATMDQVMEEYDGKVRRVFRDFPLSFHPDAEKAAEAAQCAFEQDEETFWEYHSLLFANQDRLAVSDLKGYAEDLGLDTEEFGLCLDSGRYADEVAKDLADGQAVGVGGTPAFFVNGQMVSGAQPIGNFRAVIDAELGG